MLFINVAAVAIGMMMFLICAYAFDSLNALLYVIVFTLMARSIAFELVIERLINVRLRREFVMELLLTVVFIIAAGYIPGGFAWVFYLCFAVLYVFIKRNSLLALLRK